MFQCLLISDLPHTILLCSVCTLCHLLKIQIPIKYRSGITSTSIIYESGEPNYNFPEPGGSSSNCLTLVPKETCQKSNYKEPIDSKSDCNTIIGNMICHMNTHNKIVTQFYINTHETYITQKCNSLHRKNADTTKICRH